MNRASNNAAAAAMTPLAGTSRSPRFSCSATAGRGLAPAASAELSALEEGLRALVRAADAALVTGLAPLLEGDPSALRISSLQASPIPDGDHLASALEAKARALLLQPYLPVDEVGQVTRIVRCAADLRCVIRGARQAMQLAILVLENPSNNIEAREVAMAQIRMAARAVLNLAERTGHALEPGRPAPPPALGVAAAYREADTARAEAEAQIRCARGDRLTSIQRAARAILWSVAVAGENMARVAARFTLAA